MEPPGEADWFFQHPKVSMYTSTINVAHVLDIIPQLIIRAAAAN